MKIDINVQKENVFFDWSVSNYPGRIMFIDTSSKNVIEVNLELDAFVHLIHQIFKKIDVVQLTKEKSIESDKGENHETN